MSSAAIFTILNRGVAFLKGPFLIYFILTEFSNYDQGVWYLLMSFGAIYTFLDFGFSIIITQYVSHEFGLLKNNKLTQEFYSNVTNILTKFIKIYLFIFGSLICYIIIVAVFFMSDTALSEWVLYSMLLSLNFLISPLQFAYMGIDKVGKVQSSIFFGNFVGLIAQITSLYIGLKFFSLAMGILFSLIVNIVFFWSYSKSFWKNIWKNIWKNRSNGGCKNFSELTNLQLRYAISWISGFFMFNTIVPIISKTIDIEYAGKIGLAINILSAIYGVAAIWGFISIPKFNMNVAQKKFDNAKVLLKRSAALCVVTFIILTLIFYFLSQINLIKYLLVDRLPSIDILITLFMWFLWKLILVSIAN